MGKDDVAILCTERFVDILYDDILKTEFGFTILVMVTYFTYGHPFN